MRYWYVGHDLLGSVPERIIPQRSSLTETVDRIHRDAFGDELNVGLSSRR